MPSNSNNSFRRFIQRKIQIDIVTVFILLLTASTCIILFYTYKKNYDNILDLSETIVGQVNQALVEKVNDFVVPTQILVEETKGLITKPEEITPSNLPLISYLINSLSVNQMLYSINIATSDGKFLSVINLTRAGFYTYFSEPTKPLPPGSKHAIRWIDLNAASPTETWQYLDTDGTVIASEKIEPSYDARTDPWYKSMEEWPRLHWNSVNLPRGATKYMSQEEEGVTVSSPILDKEGKILAVVGINVTLRQLSNFISFQKIGENGIAFVLDPEGNILIPSSLDTAPLSDLHQKMIQEIYKKFSSTQKQNYFLKEQGIEYIAKIVEYSLTLEEKWYVGVIVPFNDFFEATIQTQRRTMLISLGILVIFSIFIYFASRHISQPVVQLAKDVDRIRHFDFTKPNEIHSHIVEINTLDTSINAMRAALKSFGRYIPKDIVKVLIEQGQEIALGGERREITVMFTDIANFTTYSEAISMEKLTPFLTAYFDSLSKILLEEGGTIDKYIGDSIMVFWGAPQPIANQETKACLAALRCLTVCMQRQKENPTENWMTRFGIARGEVIVGNIGTDERMNYTVMGDTVNTAARLQALNKEYATSIIITEAVQKNIGETFIARPLDFLAVKGKKIKISVYELMGTAEGEFGCSTEQKELSREFAKGYFLFHEGKLEEAKTQFFAVQQRFPSDLPTKIYLDRIQKG